MKTINHIADHPETKTNNTKTAKPNLIEKLSMKAILTVFDRINCGTLVITMPDGTKKTFGENPLYDSKEPRCAELFVKDYRFFTQLLFHGDIGFGELYTSGDWETTDLAAIVRLFIRNNNSIKVSAQKNNRISRSAEFFLHWLRRNSIHQSKKNIHAHYDLGNTFFASFLDQSMMYSCAIHNSDMESLEQSQKNKLHAIIEKAKISRDDHVLEIGCGWGGFAIEAVKMTGCKVTGITISPEQLKLARKRVDDAGLSDRVNIELRDYRNIQGMFDKIVSIEMLEAVGKQYLGKYFSIIDKSLKPSGIAVIQVITIPDYHYKDYCKRTDWLQKYIFPGGHVPSLSAITNALAKSTKLTIDHIENIGKNYALTLNEWRNRFDSASAELETMGFDKNFQRLWQYYLSSCEAGFQTKILHDLQLVLSK